MARKTAEKAVKKSRKKVFEKIDGLGPKDKRNLRNAIRQVWHRSHVRKLAVARSIGKDGFSYCELCKKKSPKVFIDHVKPVGELDAGFIERMFVASKLLKCLCKKCHQVKTNAENAERRRREKIAKLKAESNDEENFY